MTHPFGVAGLVLNTWAAFGLLIYSGKPYAGSPLTEEQLRSMYPALPKLRQRIRRQIFGYRASITALLLGFPLQLIDLLRG